MAHSLPRELIELAEEAIRAYGAARVKFRGVQQQLVDAHLLFGNDNKVGIAGEFWALRFYLWQGYTLEEVPKHSNNAAFDFTVSRQAVKKLVSVKSITAENKMGKTSMVKAGATWDELCIVLMDENLYPVQFGIASHAAFAAQCPGSGKAPANRRWLAQGWMHTTPAAVVLKP